MGERESERITKAGGQVVATKDGKLRVAGRIQVTRAIGDVAMKQHGVVPTPEVSMHRVCVEDDFVMLATDGVWDVVNEKEAVRNISSTARHVDFGAKSLCIRAWELGSDDNISAVCVYLNHDSVDYHAKAMTYQS